VNASPQRILPFASSAISWDEVLANGQGAINEKGELRTNPAHLPPEPELPDIYALCPGCEEHPGGGIFPASELARSQSCPAGQRLRAGAAGSRFEEKEGRPADREGSAVTALKRRNSTLPSSLLDLCADDRLRGGSFPQDEALTLGSHPETGLRFFLTRPLDLCSRWIEAQRLHVARVWFFRRRAGICRKRLSRIANVASSIS
jgi:hypothetical protein